GRHPRPLPRPPAPLHPSTPRLSPPHAHRPLPAARRRLCLTRARPGPTANFPPPPRRRPCKVIKVIALPPSTHESSPTKRTRTEKNEIKMVTRRCGSGISRCASVLSGQHLHRQNPSPGPLRGTPRTSRRRLSVGRRLLGSQ